MLDFQCIISEDANDKQFYTLLSIKRDNGKSEYRFKSNTRVRALAEVFNIVSEITNES